MHAAGVVAEHRRPERAQARPERRERTARDRRQRDAGATATPWGSSAIAVIAAAETSAAGTSTTPWPRRSTRRPSSGPVTPFASAYAPATAPPAANEPVSPRTWRISTSPSADAGSRPAIEARNSRVNPGTRSRLPIVTRSVAVAIAEQLAGARAAGARDDSARPESGGTIAARSHAPPTDPAAPGCAGAVIAYRFGPEDLGRVRFAISPLFEIAASLDVLRDPARHAMHAPWVATARERLAGARPLAARSRRAGVRLPAGLRPPAAGAPAGRVRLRARPRAGDAAGAGRP